MKNPINVVIEGVKTSSNRVYRSPIHCPRRIALHLCLPSILLVLSGSILTLSEAADTPAASARWLPVAPMSIPRSLHTATLLPNGKVLVAGGLSTGTVEASAEIYDPATGTWEAANSMSETRVGHYAFLLDDGRVLVITGNVSDPKSTEFYDPNTGVWTPGPSVLQKRSNFAATRLADGRILVAGGRGDNGLVRDCELYDLVASAWRLT